MIYDIKYRKRKNFRPVQILTFSPRVVKNKFRPTGVVTIETHVYTVIFFLTFFKMIEKDEIFYGSKISTFTVISRDCSYLYVCIILVYYDVLQQDTIHY